MVTFHKRALCAVAAFGLVACVPVASADVATQLAVAESNTQAALRTCTRLLDERRISIADATRCDSVTRQAFALIDGGRLAAKTGDISGAEKALGATRAILVEAERIAKQ